MRGLETDPPVSGFGARDPQPTARAVGSGECRSGTGEWPGGLDSPRCKCEGEVEERGEVARCRCRRHHVGF